MPVGHDTAEKLQIGALRVAHHAHLAGLKFTDQADQLGDVLACLIENSPTFRATVLAIIAEDFADLFGPVDCCDADWSGAAKLLAAESEAARSAAVRFPDPFAGLGGGHGYRTAVSC
jgi:hypothetical protein